MGALDRAIPEPAPPESATAAVKLPQESPAEVKQPEFPAIDGLLDDLDVAGTDRKPTPAASEPLPESVTLKASASLTVTAPPAPAEKIASTPEPKKTEPSAPTAEPAKTAEKKQPAQTAPAEKVVAEKQPETKPAAKAAPAAKTTSAASAPAQEPATKAASAEFKEVDSLLNQLDSTVAGEKTEKTEPAAAKSPQAEQKPQSVAETQKKQPAATKTETTSSTPATAAKATTPQSAPAKTETTKTEAKSEQPATTAKTTPAAEPKKAEAVKTEEKKEAPKAAPAEKAEVKKQPAAKPAAKEAPAPKTAPQAAQYKPKLKTLDPVMQTEQIIQSAPPATEEQKKQTGQEKQVPPPTKKDSKNKTSKSTAKEKPVAKSKKAEPAKTAAKKQPETNTAAKETPAAKSAAEETAVEQEVVQPPPPDFTDINSLLAQLDTAVTGKKNDKLDSTAPEKEQLEQQIPPEAPEPQPEQQIQTAQPAAEPQKTAEKAAVEAVATPTAATATVAAAAQPAKETPKQQTTQTPPAADNKTAATSIVKVQKETAAASKETAITSGETDEDKKNKVQFKGSRYLKFRTYGSSGNSSQFLSREGLTNNGARVEQGTDMSVSADLGEDVKVNGSFYEMPHQEREMKFQLERGKYGATYGDFSAAVEGGTLAAFSKDITGIQFDYKTKRTKISAVTSNSKSQAKSISFTGRNIKGPYDLNANDLVPESINVQINNVPVSSSDYVLDAFSGEITFNSILGPNDYVLVTYEQRLTGNLSEGQIFAFAADSQSKNEKFSYGFSHLAQDANRQAQQLTESVEGETAVATTCNSNCSPTASCIKVNHPFIVRSSYLNGTESIFKNGSLVPLEPNNDYNLIGTSGIYCIYGNYAEGKFMLPSAPASTDTFTVSYTYYPQDSVIEYIDNELLGLDNTGAFGYPANQTIYTGSEQLYECNDEALTSCDLAPMQAGVDYTIDEKQNQISFTTPIPINVYVKISYWRYPDISSLASQYQHTVDDFRLKYEPDKQTTIQYERATSNADIAGQTIPVINETVAILSSELNCANIDNLKSCTFQLANIDVSQGSLVVYFDDRLSSEGVVSNTKYTVDYSRGQIIFSVLIPSGTQIIADYQYSPSGVSGLVNGSRNSFAAAYIGDKTQAKLNLVTGDTLFTPIGGSNTLETRRLNYSIQHKLANNINFSAGWLNVDNAADIAETHKRTSKSADYALSFASKAITNFSLTYNTRNNSDDYNPAQTSSDENKIALNLGMPVPKLKKADLTFGYSKSDHKDNTATQSQTDTLARTLGFNYQPSKKLMLTSMLTYNAVDTANIRTAYTSTNKSSQLGMNWTPIPLLMIAADVDEQNTSDTRPTVAPRSVNRSRIALSTQPFSRFKSVQVSFTQQDSPSINGPSTGTKTSMYSTGLVVTKSFSFLPSLTVSETYVGDTSSTNNTSKRYEFEYRPPGRPYHAVLTLQDTIVDTRSVSQTTKSTTDNWNVALGYDPSQIWSYMATYQKDKYSSIASSYSTGTLKTRVTRKMTTSNQWFQFQNIARTGTTSDKNSLLELGTENQLSKIVTFNISYRYSSYKNSLESKNNYSGNLIEGTLKATF